MEAFKVETLTKAKRTENQSSSCDYEKDRNQEFLLDEMQGINADVLCLHEPFQLDLMNCEYNGDVIVHIFQCKCGKKVTEFFRLSKREVS